jgi:hypothetical protein
VNVQQPFAARHPFVMTIPTRVQTGTVPVELLQNIPSTLKHLQFRRIYGRYDDLLQVIQRNDRLQILNLYEIGDVEALHLEKIIEMPIAQSLKILRIRHLPHVETDHGVMIAKVLPYLTSLETFTFEICSLQDEPFFSTFVRCKSIRHFKFGYCDQVTLEGIKTIARHGNLKSMEFMPYVALDMDSLRMIIAGNPQLSTLFLPKETVSPTMQTELPYVVHYR